VVEQQIETLLVPGSIPGPTTILFMKIYQLKTAKEFYNSIKGNFTIEELMQMYASEVAKKFAAECVNDALGNKMEVSNMLHIAIEKKYNNIEW